MSPRVLFIGDDARYAALVQHHLGCAWPEAQMLKRPGHAQSALGPEFLAQGFEAVLVDQTCRDGRGGQWASELAARPGFAPVILLAAGIDERATRDACSTGASAVVGHPRIDHVGLLAAVEGAAQRQRAAVAAWRASPAAVGVERFGGATLPGYRQIRQLATGSVCDLYLAESDVAGALVVLKVARTSRGEGGDDPVFRRFVQELEIVRRVHASAVATIYDVGMSGLYGWLAMEYFRAGDLRARMRGGMTPHDALRNAAQVARALGVVHKAGVLHRDVKPGNVMVRDDGSLALIDFGLARYAALDYEISDHGQIFGTPHYMSPEQGHGEPIDARSDLYSVGIMLYEMLAGRKPYSAENPMAIIYMHRKAPLPVLAAALAPLQPVLERLLAKQPDDRFESGAAAADAMEAAAASLG
jgi:eukaryotic-like serine/threonine-protein kinase